MYRSMTRLFLLCALAAPTACGGGGDGDGLDIRVRYHEGSARLRVEVNRGVLGGETLHAQLRRGGVGTLDCREQFAGIDDITGSELGGTEVPTFEGPTVPAEAFEPLYDGTEWLTQDPTPEMLAEIAMGGWIVDVCLMEGNGVVSQVEVDISRTRDSEGADGKFDGDEDEQISSVGAYAAVVVAEMGEIPFFEKVGDNDYLSANCLDGTPIPTVITHEDGTVERPVGRDTARGRTISGYFYYNECDNQQFIYDSCEPNAVDGMSNGPRVQSARNEQGTHWVLLCRKSQEAEGEYYDIAMLGNNPYTGKTAFFQNALGRQMDGLNVPHPGDTVSSERSPNTWEHIWQGLHGGLGFGIQCTDCHSQGQGIIHTPWIDGALNEDGTTVIPRAGQNEDYALGFNDAPFSLVAADRVCSGSRCGWDLHPILDAPEIDACTSCHTIAQGDIWARDWLARMEPNAAADAMNDTGWANGSTAHGRSFDVYAWMPDGLEGVDPENWAQSEFGIAIDFIQMCADNPSDARCTTRPYSTEPISEAGRLPEIELEGMDLAREAATILGARVVGSTETQREVCLDCHSVSTNGFDHWKDLTDAADRDCNLDRLDALYFEEDPSIGRFDGVDFTQGQAQRLLNFVNDAPEADITAAGVRSDALSVILQERPFPTMEALAEVDGIGEATMRSLRDYTSMGVEEIMPVTQSEAREMIDCMREAPEDPDSVFEASKIGIYVAGAQYGLFQDLFRRAYGEDDYLVQYLQFRARVGMPKGGHPKFSQRQFAIVLKWFRLGLPNLTDVVEQPVRPTSCEDLLTPELATHISDMQFEGWEAVNEENGIRMFGCDSGSGVDCFTANPDVTSALKGMGTLRTVTDLDFRTSFWTRTSADGRFIGNGGRSVEGFGSTITDMQRMVNIGIDASYDPGFFPDNSGFIFQGGGAGFCAQSILETATGINFDEPECTRIRGIALYQHVARGLEGGDYFVINSQFTSDSGGGTSDPRATWGASARMKFTPMIFNGSTYEQLQQVSVDSPFEGDSVLSPSNRVVISRLSGENSETLGYVLRRVQATQFGSDYIINVDDVLGRVCMTGSKANISFDERFFVTHTYEEDGTANIWLVDLNDGSRHQVTDVEPGQLALFPHFRSDGWFYFLLREDGESRRSIVASDLALRLRAGL